MHQRSLSGRREDRLKQICQSHPGMRHFVLDVADGAAVGGGAWKAIVEAARSGATLVNVSSGLAFVPLARFPVYCATKAAVHAWTLCLRHQVRNSGVRVIELIPPYVATELGGPDKPAPSYTSGRGPMPLDSFIAEAMKGSESGAEEIAVAGANNWSRPRAPIP